MSEPFKVGDVIKGVTAGSLATIIAVTDEGDLWAKSWVLPTPFTIAARNTIFWRIHVPEPERKRWTFQTERRKPTADEIYVVGSNVYHFCYQGKGDMMTQEFDVLVAGSVKPLPEEKP